MACFDGGLIGRYVCDVGCVRRRFLEWAVIREGDE